MKYDQYRELSEANFWQRRDHKGSLTQNGRDGKDYNMADLKLQAKELGIYYLGRRVLLNIAEQEGDMYKEESLEN